MLEPGWIAFSANFENLTLPTDGSDFLIGEGGSLPWKLLELRIFQRGATALTMDTLRLHRGTGGGTGTALTEYEYTQGGAAATVAWQTNPTVDVGTDTWQYRLGWNLLQEAVFLPIPELWVPFKATEDLGVVQATTTGHTGVGGQVVWAEYLG